MVITLTTVENVSIESVLMFIFNEHLYIIFEIFLQHLIQTYMQRSEHTRVLNLTAGNLFAKCKNLSELGLKVKSITH